MKCLFVSDLHGKRYDALFSTVNARKPDLVLIGGDILSPVEPGMALENFLARIKETGVEFYVIMGNDDPRLFEEMFIEADRQGILHYVHERSVELHSASSTSSDKSAPLFIAGLSYVPPTPFQLKDWERYDVSRFVDVGVLSPEEGFRTVPVPSNEIRNYTIREGLDTLAALSPPSQTIYLLHSPPHKTPLDRADIEGVMVDHAPVDPHIGSIAVSRFIEQYQPLLTLHGHVHESRSLTGEWRTRIGSTHCFSAANDTEELAVVEFDTKDLNGARLELVGV